MRSWRRRLEQHRRIQSLPEMSDLILAVDGVRYVIDPYGLAAKLMAAGELSQPLTHTGRLGVINAVGNTHPSTQIEEFLRRAEKLPTHWQFQINGLAVKSGTVQQALTAAFLQAHPSGLVRSSPHTNEVGYIGNDGRISLLLEKSTRPGKPFDLYGTSSYELAMALAALHPRAIALQSTLVQIDQDGCMETCPIEIADKQQVWGGIRGLDLDMKDPALCTRYGLWTFSDLTLEHLVAADEMTPDF